MNHKVLMNMHDLNALEVIMRLAGRYIASQPLQKHERVRMGKQLERLRNLKGLSVDGQTYDFHNLKHNT